MNGEGDRHALEGVALHEHFCYGIERMNCLFACATSAAEGKTRPDVFRRSSAKTLFKIWIRSVRIRTGSDNVGLDHRRTWTEPTEGIVANAPVGGMRWSRGGGLGNND
jgi:hypothetical protein